MEFELINREKEENCWQEEQEGEVSTLVNPWLHVSRSREDVGERVGADEVPARAVTAQSSSGSFAAAFVLLKSLSCLSSVLTQ